MSKLLLIPIFSFVCFAFAEDILYKGEPVSVEVSDSAFTLFVFQEEVEKALTSSKFAGIKVKGKEVLVRVTEGEKADLYVRTKDGRSYLFYLIPSSKPPGKLTIVDTRKQTRKEPPSIEKEREHEEILARLVKAALIGEPPSGYDVTIRTYAIDTPSLLIVVQEEWSGWEYRVLKATIVNKTKETLRIREDMEFFENILRKEFGRPYALAITKEFIKPDGKAYLVAVVKKATKSASYRSLADMESRGYANAERQGQAD